MVTWVSRDTLMFAHAQTHEDESRPGYVFLACTTENGTGSVRSLDHRGRSTFGPDHEKPRCQGCARIVLEAAGLREPERTDR